MCQTVILMSRWFTDYTSDELISVCIARQIADGDVVAQGIATPLTVAGYLLAKLTHAPNAVVSSAISCSICYDGAPVSLGRIEELWIGQAVGRAGFASAVCEGLPSVRPKEFFRPGQVDGRGNFNNVFMGGDYRRPRLRLPGCGGIADVTLFSEHVYLYVPRHSRAVFVERLDFRSGLGHGWPGVPGPRYLVSNLGQFDFAGGRMRLVSHHPGVTVDKIRKKTGFPLEVAPDVHETPPPTAEELRLLRETIDPLGVRQLETLNGARRRQRLRDIVEREAGMGVDEATRQRGNKG